MHKPIPIYASTATRRDRRVWGRRRRRWAVRHRTGLVTSATAVAAFSLLAERAAG
jgi:hypothetical protein